MIQRASFNSDSNSKKVVTAEEVEKFNDGWEPVMTLPDGRVVIKAYA